MAWWWVAMAGTPEVDGYDAPGEWDAAPVFLLEEIPGSEVRLMSDGEDLFLAVWLTGNLDDRRGLEVRFDVQDNGFAAGYEDGATLRGGVYRDTHGAWHGDGSFGFTEPDPQQDGEGVEGAARDGRTLVELRHPLRGSGPDDLAVAPGDTFGLCLKVTLDCCRRGAFPAGCTGDSTDQTGYLGVRVGRPAEPQVSRTAAEPPAAERDGRTYGVSPRSRSTSAGRSVSQSGFARSHTGDTSDPVDTTDTAQPRRIREPSASCASVARADFAAIPILALLVTRRGARRKLPSRADLASMFRALGQGDGDGQDREVERIGAGDGERNRREAAPTQADVQVDLRISAPFPDV